MSETVATSGGLTGQAWLQTPGADQFNGLDFLMRQVVAGKAFAGLVLVQAVQGGGVSTPPTVTVQPMVAQTDGFGNLTPHGPIYDIPCFRLQGGAGAVILDPVVGDIGQAIICDRDISAVKATQALSGPGSFRQNDWADGCYFGGFLNAAPTAYARISAASIVVSHPTQISLGVGDYGVVITSTGTTIDGKPFLPHTHGGVQTGGGTTGGVS